MNEVWACIAQNAPGALPVKSVSVNKSTVTYAYDALDRVTASTSSSGEKNAYAYDPAGNRTGWSRSGAKDGDFRQQATFNDANQLTQSETTGRGRGVAAGIASYSYDGAGNRVSQSVGGTATRFSYKPAGQTTQVSQEGRTTSYGYDGLGRRTMATNHYFARTYDPSAAAWTSQDPWRGTTDAPRRSADTGTPRTTRPATSTLTFRVTVYRWDFA
ncbi:MULTISPECIES: hypothetical protein [unclassified Leifsonia]|uniref:hypothetical protein n=1 Tax=unclassified Leifsonia TaxID=2663824 RepID=UPI0010ED1200|nr:MULTISPECIES: hypothetical protein [unclassified Leifsonia]TDQ02772.1 YD repeat-containing protein [Leifsonia sp. 115AMFTsu3.1]